MCEREMRECERGEKNVERKLAFTFIQDVRNTFQETYTKNDI